MTPVLPCHKRLKYRLPDATLRLSFWRVTYCEDTLSPYRRFQSTEFRWRRKKGLFVVKVPFWGRSYILPKLPPSPEPDLIFPYSSILGIKLIFVYRVTFLRSGYLGRYIINNLIKFYTPLIFHTQGIIYKEGGWWKTCRFQGLCIYEKILLFFWTTVTMSNL